MSETYTNNWRYGFYYQNYGNAPQELLKQFAEEGSPYLVYIEANDDPWSSPAGYNASITGYEVTLVGGSGDDGYLNEALSYNDGITSYAWAQTSGQGFIRNIAFAVDTDASGMPGSAVNSNNVITFDGGAGNDFSRAEIGAMAESGGASATTSNNNLTLLGGVGIDGLNASIFGRANGDARSAVFGNHVIINGGEGNDGRSYQSYWHLDSSGNESLSESWTTLWSGIGGSSYSGDNAASSTSTVNGNSLTFQGGAGNDAHIVQLWGAAYFNADVTVRNNTILLTGDGGSDDLSFYNYTHHTGNSYDFAPKITMTDNTVTLDGGAGSDVLRHFGSGSTNDGHVRRSGNVVTFDGGADSDTAMFFGRLDDYNPAQGQNGAIILTDPITGQEITVRNVETFKFGSGSFNPDDSNAFQVNQTYTLQQILSRFNSEPVARADTGSTTQNAALNVTAAAGLLANDTDADGHSLTVMAVNGQAANVGQQITLASQARLKVNADGSYSYDPSGKFAALGLNPNGTPQTASESFTYTVSDGHGGTDTETVTLTVSGLNDGPTAVGESFGTVDEPIYEGWEYLIKVSDLLKNDSDVDAGDQIQLVGVTATTATQGTVAVITDVDGEKYVAYTYKGAAGTNIAEGARVATSFTYQIQDSHGARSSATVNLNVTGLANATKMGTNGDDLALKGTDLARDVIDGLNGNDVISGLNSNDKLFGNNGIDKLYGDDGHDVLDGGRGDDRLEGGRGDDFLTGGLGADQFVFGKVYDPVSKTYVLGNLGTDTVTDFKQGVDKIILASDFSITKVSIAAQDLNGNGLADTILELSANGSVVGRVELYDVNNFGASDWLMVA